MVVPEQVPLRYLFWLHCAFEHAWHLNPSFRPEQLPDLTCPAEHLELEHELQDPCAVAEAPLRKRPLPHAGWSLHPPLAVADCPARY